MMEGRLTLWYQLTEVGGGEARIEQVKYTSTPSCIRCLLSRGLSEMLTTGTSG